MRFHTTHGRPRAEIPSESHLVGVSIVDDPRARAAVCVAAADLAAFPGREVVLVGVPVTAGTDGPPAALGDQRTR